MMSENDRDQRKSGSAQTLATINLAERFASSVRFKQLFEEGMALVEETAAYLDDNGRRDARALKQPIAMLYGSESMRLTTRLMQLASWLLLQRAVSEGEMTRQQLLDEKKKIRLETLPKTSVGAGWEQLPRPFVDLVGRSIALQKRILILDQEIYGPANADNPAARDNPVGAQLTLLSTALGAKIKV